MHFIFYDPPSPSHSKYGVRFTPDELEVIKERGLQNRLVYDLSPRGDIEEVRRKIAKKQAEDKEIQQELTLVLDQQSRDLDDWIENRHKNINFSRSERLMQKQGSLLDEIIELKDLERRLQDPNNIILVRHFSQYPDGTVDTRLFNTPAEARQFDIEIEKALRQLEKYLAQFIPEPEIPKATLPTLAFGISPERWFQSVWLVCPPGGGKTNALVNIIESFFLDLYRGDASIIVIDGQGKDQSLVAPFYHYYGDIALYIDPRNPIPINPFRKSGDRELDFNAARGMLSYFLSGMLDQPLTENHTTILENVLELIFEIPDASLYTLLDILDPNRKDLKEYYDYIEQINDPHGFVKRFLHHDLFLNRIFTPRREELVSRLYAMLRDRTFRTMFSDPRADFCLADEMNEGRLILVDCDKNYLTNRSELFGRFFIALIHQAALARSSYPPGKKKTPTYVVIDECHDFIARDERIYEILEQARKQNIGVILANQFTSQITNSRVLHSLFSATGTKLAARTSTDTAALARWLHCSEEDLADAPKHHFVFYTEGIGPAYTSFPPRKIGFGGEPAAPAKSPQHAALLAKRIRAFTDRYYARETQNWDRVAELENSVIPEIDQQINALLNPPVPVTPPPVTNYAPQSATITGHFDVTDFAIEEPAPKPTEIKPKPAAPKAASPKPLPSPAKTDGFELEGPELL